MAITDDYNMLQLHSGQMKVFKSKARFKVVCAGRRWGKSMLSIALMIKSAMKGRRRRVWYIAPTYMMAKQILWDELKQAINSKYVKKINDTTMTIILINGSELSLKGADKPDTLRGVALHTVVLDEFQDMKPDTWYKVLRPTLSSTRGDALIIGTPKGFSAFYDLWKIGQDEEMVARGQWESWQFVTADSPFIPEDEIEAAKLDLDPKSFEQEYLASFNTMSGRVYYPFERDLHVKLCKFNPKLPIWIGQDFNIDPMSATISQPQPNGEVWVTDEIMLYSSNTEEACEEIERKLWRWKQNITVFPDPAGAHRQHARGESDLDIFREKGFHKIDFPRKHPPIADRVNSVNKMLLNAKGEIRLYVDPSCRNTIESLEQVLYKPNSRDIDKAASVEHITDALGYNIHRKFPSRKRALIGISY